jgi:hypothetical protein
MAINIASLFDCLITIGIGLFLILGRFRITAGIRTPLKREQMVRALSWLGPVVIVVGALSGSATIFRIEDPAVRAVRTLNSSTPRMVDAITRFDHATAGPGRRVTIDETLITKKAADVNKVEWLIGAPLLQQNIRQSDLGKLTAQGVTIVYRYHGNDGVLIGEIECAPQHVRAK